MLFSQGAQRYDLFSMLGFVFAGSRRRRRARVTFRKYVCLPLPLSTSTSLCAQHPGTLVDPVPVSSDWWVDYNLYKSDSFVEMGSTPLVPLPPYPQIYIWGNWNDDVITKILATCLYHSVLQFLPLTNQSMLYVLSCIILSYLVLSARFGFQIESCVFPIVPVSSRLLLHDFESLVSFPLTDRIAFIS